MRTCRKCGETKPIDEFDLRGYTGRYRTDCKACRRAYQRLHPDRPRTRTKWIVGANDLLQCSRCGVFKPWTEFPSRGGSHADRLHTWCKPCFVAYKAERHQKNHEREVARIHRNTSIRVADNRARSNGYLSTHPCVDCGEQEVVVLDYDHVRGAKPDDVSRMIANGYSWARIEEEIAKCEVRCANCHRKVTARRRANTQGVREPVWVYGDPGAI